MPLQISETELQAILEVVASAASGTSVGCLMADGRVDHKLRTLQRRLDLLCGQGRLVAQGEGRARRYLVAASAPANKQLQPATDLDWLSAEACEIRSLITRPEWVLSHGVQKEHEGRGTRTQDRTPENYSPAVIGRNDPCPCGSAKKYKKCCLESDAAAKAGKTSPDHSSQRTQRAGDALKDQWTISKVACLETAEIVTRLETLGIDGCQATFVELAGGQTSALSIGNVWAGELTTPPGTEEGDFIWLAACELWKRYCPENPSMEMIDEWVTEGYDLTQARKYVDAAEVWLRAWEHVRPRLEPHMITFKAVDPVFRLTQFFGNWIQDFTIGIGNAVISDRKYADIGMRVIGEGWGRGLGEGIGGGEAAGHAQKNHHPDLGGNGMS